jgi:putative ABC transport system permease protein
VPDVGGALPLDALDLMVATALVLVAGVVSLALRLGLEWKLFVASVRTVVQLLLVGFVLSWVFAIDRPVVLVAILLVMVGAAGRAAVARSGRTFEGAHLRAFATLVLTATLTTFSVTGLVVGVTPWWKPQYVIPLMGMVLGNGLTGISLCLDQMLETLSDRRDRVETELALGASRWEAARAPLSDAVRRGMIPILNSMAVVGIVSLPGMMTGQILQGADPVDAVKYQIVVMFMIAAATSLGCMLVGLLVYRRLFNDRHQLRWREIRKRS